jgi:molecular chaperone GrpE (heat shock protein)
MRDQIVPKLHKWPFLVGDILLLGLAFFIYRQSALPLTHWEVLTCAFCVVAGAVLAVLPYLSEYRAAVQLAETRALVSTVEQINKLEQLAAQITNANSAWHTVQESADKTVKAAREIAAGMAAEVKSFNEFIQRANDSERAALRLEADKARRAEGEWLHTLVRLLDHVFALYQAAVRSGQASLIEQLGAFQNACRDAARRVGVTPFAADPDEPFDAQRHQVMDADGNAKAVESGIVEATLASGYTFQGRLLRPALVRLRDGNGSEPQNIAPKSPTTADAQLPQSQLPLEK